MIFPFEYETGSSSQKIQLKLGESKNYFVLRNRVNHKTAFATGIIIIIVYKENYNINVQSNNTSIYS